MNKSLSALDESNYKQHPVSTPNNTQGKKPQDKHNISLSSLATPQTAPNTNNKDSIYRENIKGDNFDNDACCSPTAFSLDPHLDLNA
jgi:hypothetical protein